VHRSLEQLLDQVAFRGSWFGGGSVAAMSAALSAALLEKLAPSPALGRRLRSIRQDCLALIEVDARTFARVIQSTRMPGNRRAFVRALKAATAVPLRLFRHAQTIQAISRAAQRRMKPRFRSDLQCVTALARASADGARALILTNVAWLNDHQYTKTVRRALRATR
jgi:formiminotetrahydrofolate cyclodeaminase